MFTNGGGGFRGWFDHFSSGWICKRGLLAEEGMDKLS